MPLFDRIPSDYFIELVGPALSVASLLSRYGLAVSLVRTASPVRFSSPLLLSDSLRRFCNLLHSTGGVGELSLQRR